MAAHRYWRINFLGCISGTNLLVAEVEMHTSIGGANVCGSGTASASSYYSSHTPASAFDGNTATAWGVNTTLPQWLEYDFGSGNAFDIVELKMYSSTNAATTPKIFELQWSDDNSTWTTSFAINAQQTGGWATSSWASFNGPTLTYSNSHRYWRVNFNITPAGNDIVIEELEMHITAGGYQMCYGGAATAQSSYSTHTAPLAVDGNTTTYWEANVTLPVWWEYDFGADFAFNIDEVKMYSGTNANTIPSNFDVQYSDDNSTWTTAWSKSGITGWSTSSWATFTAPQAYTFSLSTGTFALSGVATTIVASHLLPVSVGSFSFSGKAVFLSPGVTFSPTAYSLTGVNAALALSFTFPVSAGAFALTGYDLSFSTLYGVAAQTGIFALVGNNLFYDLARMAGTGAFSLVGHAITPIRSLICSSNVGAFALTGYELYFGKTLGMGIGAFSLVGNDLTTQKSSLCPLGTGAFIETGAAATLTASRHLSLDTGSFTLSGQAVGSVGAFPVATGAFALTGYSIEIILPTELNVSTGAFALSGASIGLKATRRLVAGVGAFDLLGVSSELLWEQTFVAATGQFILPWRWAALVVGHLLIADVGAFDEIGVSVTLDRLLRLSAAEGAIIVTGNSSLLERSGELDLAAGAFALSGQDIALAHILQCASGAFTIAGAAIQLLHDSVVFCAPPGQFLVSGALMSGWARLHVGAAQVSWRAGAQAVPTWGAPHASADFVAEGEAEATMTVPRAQAQWLGGEDV